MKSIFDFKDYRAFLKEALPVEGPLRGARNKLAEALNCQKGFISQVLSGLSHFSLEHGMKISRFLSLGENEEEYFLLLLHKSRAGSKDLEKFYEKRLTEVEERRKQIKERVRASSTLTTEEQMIYYSSWHYVAVHMCLMVPELRTRSKIGAFLGLNLHLVSKALEFLIQVGLTQEDGENLTAGPSRIHLPGNSPLISKHHSNWRIRAIESLDFQAENDLHYSLVMSISDEAATKIRDILLNTIQNVEPVLKSAEDKNIYALTLDLFGLSKLRKP